MSGAAGVFCPCILPVRLLSLKKKTPLMTFTHKLKKAFQPQTYFGQGKAGAGGPVARYRAWQEHREQQRIRERRLSLTVENLLASVPPGELERVQALSQRENMDDVFWTKYLDAHKWLTLNIRYAKELGLVERPPRDVLDLGCGGGVFPRGVPTSRGARPGVRSGQGSGVERDDPAVRAAAGGGPHPGVRQTAGFRTEVRPDHGVHDLFQLSAEGVVLGACGNGISSCTT